MQLSKLARPKWHWLLLTLVSAIASYGILASGAYLFVKYHRGVQSISYLDLALPTHWERYRIKRGEHLIEQALQSLQEGDGPQGLRKLRLGLARAPENRQGRLVLAQLFDSNNRPELARQTLTDGLKYHRTDRDYVATTLSFLLNHNDDSLALELCDQLLTDKSASQEIAQLAALNAASACFHRGNYDQAESYLVTHRVSESRPGRLLLSRIEWERGLHPLALMQLRNLQEEFPASESIYTQLQDYLSEAGRHDEAQRLAILHQIAYPERPRSRLDELRAIQAEGDPLRLTQAADQMIQAFASNPTALLALGDFAATSGNIDLARKLLVHFQKANLPQTGIIRLILIEALLTSKHYREALAESSVLMQAPDSPTHVKDMLPGFDAIAHYGLGDPGSGFASLTSFMSRPQLRPDSLLAIANRLVPMGYPAAARTILEQASQLSPHSQPILTRLIELDLQTKNIAPLTRNLRSLLAMRKPSHDLLTDAVHLLASDRYLFLSERTELIHAMERALSPQQTGLMN